MAAKDKLVGRDPVTGRFIKLDGVEKIGNDLDRFTEKFSGVFESMEKQIVMQSSFLESIALVTAESLEIEKKRLDLEVERIRDEARNDALARAQMPGTGREDTTSTEPEDAPKKEVPKEDGNAFLANILPGVGTFIGSLLGTGGGALLMSAGAKLFRVGILAAVAGPVSQFIGGAVSEVLSMLDVERETAAKIAKTAEVGVQAGIFGRIFGKKFAIGAAIGAMISENIKGILDSDGDGIVTAFGIELASTAHLNAIGGALGGAIGFVLPGIIARTVPSILAAMNIGPIVGGALAAAASGSKSLLKSGAAKAAGATKFGLRHAGKFISRFGGPLAAITAIATPSDLAESDAASSLDMRQFPIDGTLEEQAAWNKELEGKQAAQMELSRATDVHASDTMDEAARKEQERRAAQSEKTRIENEARAAAIDLSNRISAEDIAMNIAIPTPEITYEFSVPLGIDQEQANKIDLILERNRQLHHLRALEDAAMAKATAPLVVAPTTVGGSSRANVTNNNITNNTKITPAPTLKPAFIP